MLFRHAKSQRPRTSKLTGSKKRPRFESLEDRRLLAITIDTFDNDLQIAKVPDDPPPADVAQFSSLVTDSVFEGQVGLNERGLGVGLNLEDSTGSIVLRTADLDDEGNLTMPLNELVFSSVPTIEEGVADIFYGGVDGTGLGGVDLTQDDLNDRFEFNAGVNLAGLNVEFTVIGVDAFTSAAAEIPVTTDGLIPDGQAPIPIFFSEFDNQSVLTNVEALFIAITAESGVGPNAINGRIDNVRVIGPLDFGDAPDTYGTTLASNGARHVFEGPFLGAVTDFEADAAAPLDGTGDDLTGDDDEDGVTFPNPLLAGTTVDVTVVSSDGGGQLNYFFDFDGDGTFGNNGNEIFSVALTGGEEPVPVAIPADAQSGATFARFRISTAGNLSPVGLAADGEVEDYGVEIVGQPASISGKVFVDSNKNGHFDRYHDKRGSRYGRYGEEKELEGVRIILSLQETGVIVDEVLTDEWGLYRFENLQPRVGYKITQIQPQEYKDGPNLQGTPRLGGVIEYEAGVVDDMFTHIALESGVHAVDYNFVEYTKDFHGSRYRSNYHRYDHHRSYGGSRSTSDGGRHYSYGRGSSNAYHSYDTSYKNSRSSRTYDDGSSRSTSYGDSYGSSRSTSDGDSYGSSRSTSYGGRDYSYGRGSSNTYHSYDTSYKNSGRSQNTSYVGDLQVQYQVPSRRR